MSFSWRARLSARLRGYLRRSQLTGAQVLVYHGVQKSVSDPILDTYTIDIATFRQHLHFLKRHRKPVPLSVLIEALRSGDNIDPRWCVLTFDDALDCQTTLVAEELSREKLPWALAIPAGSIESRRAVWTYAVRLILLDRWPHLYLPHPTLGKVAAPNDRYKRSKVIDEIVGLLRDSATGEDRIRFIDELYRSIGSDHFEDCIAHDKRFVPADWQAIRQLSTYGVELLSHGYHHFPLNQFLKSPHRQREIELSKSLIAERTGSSVLGFALPNGIADPNCIREIESAGYEACLTSAARPVASGTDRFSIGRFGADCPIEILKLQIN